MALLAAGEHEAVLNGIRIHYTIRGEGPALIVHSGGPGVDARSWEDLAGIDRFATVIVLHPRGSGLSDPAPGDAYLLADYASDVAALCDHLGLERPAIMGWSHGGMVAQQFAFTYPDKLSKLILLATTATISDFLQDIDAAVDRFRDQPWFENSYAALKKEWAGEYETDEDMGELFGEMIKFYFKEYDGRAHAYHERTKHMPIRVTPLKTFNAEAETMDLREQLRKVKVPALVLAGRHDFLTTVAMAEEMAQYLPDAQLKIFEQSGHFALVEEPEAFSEAIRTFLIDD